MERLQLIMRLRFPIFHLTNLERSSDHCSNIAGYVMEAEQNQMNIHDSIRAMKKESANYQKQYGLYEAKYL